MKESWKVLRLNEIGLVKRICGEGLRALATCEGNDQTIVKTPRIALSAGKRNRPHRLSRKGVGTSVPKCFTIVIYYEDIVNSYGKSISKIIY